MQREQQDLFCVRKVCVGCQSSLPLEDFAPIKSKPGCLTSRCRTCTTAYMKAWHAKRPDYAKDQSRKWYAENVKQWKANQERRQKKPPPVGPLESERLKLVEDLQQREPDKQLAPTSKTDGLPKVYFVQEGDSGPIKIGFTLSTLVKRLTQIQNGNPRMLHIRGVMDGGRDLEARIHAAFAHLVIQGTKEWFRPEPDLLEFVDTVAALPPPPRQSKAGFRGVYPVNKGKQYIARLRRGTEVVFAASYPTALEAAQAYDDKARDLLGDKALLNFPREGERHWSTWGKSRLSDVG